MKLYEPDKKMAGMFEIYFISDTKIGVISGHRMHSNLTKLSDYSVEVLKDPAYSWLRYRVEGSVDITVIPAELMFHIARSIDPLSPEWY